jgi:hypothetical protein
LLFLKSFFVVLGIKARDSLMLGKHSTMYLALKSVFSEKLNKIWHAYTMEYYPITKIMK